MKDATVTPSMNPQPPATHPQPDTMTDPNQTGWAWNGTSWVATFPPPPPDSRPLPGSESGS